MLLLVKSYLFARLPELLYIYMFAWNISDPTGQICVKFTIGYFLNFL